MKRYHFALLMLTFALPANAIPPPALPPVSAEIQAAANVLVDQLPIEEALMAGNTLSTDGMMAAMVSNHLMNHVGRYRRVNCNREVLRDHLAIQVAPRLQAVLPEVILRVRRSIAYEVGQTMSLSDLIAARVMMESTAGRALMLSIWGLELRNSNYIAIEFATGLNSEFDALLRSAERECRASHGRPPERIQ